MCAQPGKMCQSEMMMIDAKGGAGKDSEQNYERLKYDGALTQQGNEAPGATFPASGRPPNTIKDQPQGMMPRTVAPEVNTQKNGPSQGQDQPMPDMPGMNSQSPAPAQLNKK
jgi:cytochrome o ubiquinol oxidase subunit II